MVSSYSSGLMNSGTEWDRARIKAYDAVQNQFGSLPLNCQGLDRDLKRLQEAIIDAYKTPLSSDPRGSQGLYDRAYKEALETKKQGWETMFDSRNCRDIIEDIRLTTGGVKETEYAIKSEKQILTTDTKDQNIYIGVGAVVMLVGLFMVLNK